MQNENRSENTNIIKNVHECIFMDARCIQDEVGNLLILKKETVIFAKYCPFCGKSE